jgi:hypothetical protein
MCAAHAQEAAANVEHMAAIVKVQILQHQIMIVLLIILLRSVQMMLK